MPASFAHLTPPFTWRQFPSLLGVGPLWFAEMLLFFCLGYVIWRRLVRIRVQPTERVFSSPSYRAVGLFVLVLALASYLIRIVISLGLSIPILGFPTLAYLPQYLSFFILGAIAFRRNWFQTIPGSLGKTGVVVAGLSTIVLFPLALSGGVAFLGHGTFQSAVYALWDSTFSVGMCLGLITCFRHFLNRQNRFGRFLSQQAFTVYIIHIPVIVLLALAFLVRKIPFASRIL